MRSFSLTDLSNKSGEVIEAAYSGPVDITRREKRKFVIMTAEQYDRLRKVDDPRRVYEVGETPTEIASLFENEVNRLSKGEGYDD